MSPIEGMKEGGGMDFRLTQIIIFFITAFLMKVAIADQIRDHDQVKKGTRPIYMTAEKLGK